jgi:hypothetical protein
MKRAGSESAAGALLSRSLFRRYDIPAQRAQAARWSNRSCPSESKYAMTAGGARGLCEAGTSFSPQISGTAPRARDIPKAAAANSGHREKMPPTFIGRSP